jgi:drug/metabolite transporter (DMT)-like permease
MRMLTGSRDRLIGAALILLSAVAWSLNGLYTRVLTVDAWTALVGRGMATVVMIGLILVALHGRRGGPLIVTTLRSGPFVVLCGAASMITFIVALFNTTVANVTVIYFISPLIAAVLARVLIGDLLVARTLVAFAIALSGVVIMVGASVGTERLFGDLIALVMSATFAVVIVEMRRKPEIDNLAATLLMSVVTVLVIFPFAELSSITLLDAAVLCLFSFTSNVLGFFLFMSGVRRIPPTEAGLIATVEIVLAPLWVWLAFAEEPGAAAFAGGGIVLLAVFFHLYGELRRPASRRPDVAAAEVETPAKLL